MASIASTCPPSSIQLRLAINCRRGSPALLIRVPVRKLESHVRALCVAKIGNGGVQNCNRSQQIASSAATDNFSGWSGSDDGEQAVESESQRKKRLQETKVVAVVLDLDGTLLDTENATKYVVKEFLAKYGKELDKEREDKKRLGMTLQALAVATVEVYNLPLTPSQFIDEIMPMYREKWSQTEALPGANRLIKHLHKNEVPFALASNSSREHIDEKVSFQEGWNECFSTIIGSNQVKSGKPSPDIFLEAASRMGVDAAKCLVIEDSLVGVKAAKAAGMKVVAVPSQSEADWSLLADSTLHSLLEFQPEKWGLPPFDDWVDNALPIEPIYLSILYKNGSAREVTDGGKSGLPCQVSGLYFGYAESAMHRISKVVVGFGQYHHSCTATRSIQVFIIDEKAEQISDQQMRLLLVGYIRGLNSMESEPMDMEILEEDKIIASSSLEKPAFIRHFSSLPSNKWFISGRN